MGVPAPQLVTIGDNVVDCYVDLGWMYPGGNTVNVAVHAARLGVPGAYVGVVGSDAEGRCILEALRAEGVSTSAVTVADGPTARAVVHVVEGNRVFGSGLVGVSRFDPTPQHLDLLSRAQIVHTGECSMLDDHVPALQHRARRLSFDFSERPWDYIESLAGHVDIAFCSMPDDDSALHRAETIAALGPRIVVVTQGEHGALVLADGTAHHSPAPDVQVVDTLGAGDALAARFLAGVLDGEAPPLALDAATRYATTTCADYGAFGHRTALSTPHLTPATTPATPKETA